jgi:hypothetical protein
MDYRETNLRRRQIDVSTVRNAASKPESGRLFSGLTRTSQLANRAICEAAWSAESIWLVKPLVPKGLLQIHPVPSPWRLPCTMTRALFCRSAIEAHNGGGSRATTAV